RGAAPTALEEKYFAEDKDPKKREKLLDLLLKDPAVAKKLGDDWRKKMLEPPLNAMSTNLRVPVTLFKTEKLRVPVTLFKTEKLRVPVTLFETENRVTKPTPLPDRFEKLVGELIGAKKTDEQML